MEGGGGEIEAALHHARANAGLNERQGKEEAFEKRHEEAGMQGASERESEACMRVS